MLGAKTRAVIVTHLYGNHADVDGIRAALDAAGRRDVLLVEDCAQAHGARRGGRLAGSQGIVACFSFYPTKNLGALGDAGAVVTGDEAIAAKLRALHQYGWTERYKNTLAYGRNSRVDELQAAFLGVKLPRLDELNGMRRRVLDRYRAALPPSYMLCARQGEETVAHLAVIACPDRGAAAAHLERRGVETGVHYPILDCDQPGWSAMHRKVSALEVSRRSVARILTVPCYPHLSDAECGAVCDALAGLP
jgi:dTDP-4-amino-4,6-dideoxygalactose transaminase